MSTLMGARSVPKISRCYRSLHVYAPRSGPNTPYSRPGPPPLPAAEQKEFEELVRNAQRPAASTAQPQLVKSGNELHPDARRPIQPQFVGDVNPTTGERGGPKQEPVPEGREDWSYGGRVTDF
ncbi:hypothetical protein BDV93DRAFT_519026 [Ceratobasidium sp. AG-I]|nr:hypothetical protein BDV93DRAFT_519026 [Ceratobasidium sp. AG-I]